MQLTHYDIINTPHKKEIILVLDQVFSPDNIGLLLRTAEAFGVKEVYIISTIHEELSRKMKRLTRSVENQMAIYFYKEVEGIYDLLKAKAATIYCLEYTDKSLAYTNISTVVDESCPIAFVVGNERYGISEFWLEKAQQHFHIPMYGKNSSMNVAVASGILLAEVTKKSDEP